MEQTQKYPTPTEDNKEGQRMVEEARVRQERDEKSKTEAQRERVAKYVVESDVLLNEIDAVLEENAKEFVEAYIQKGGQ